MIKEKRKIDNFIILSHQLISPEATDFGSGCNTIKNILLKYRQEVNPDMLFVSVDLSGKGVSILADNEKNRNDILITGFSDSILRFIAERGDNNQLRYVENVDVAKKLVAHSSAKIPAHLKELDKLKTTQEEMESIIEESQLHSSGRWQTARIFISSTFLDMHAERDVLTRHVFPELRERCKKRRINVVEVDLRWGTSSFHSRLLLTQRTGVTEEESQQNKSVQICLEEVDRCRPFFVSLLGSRYGWRPDSYTVPDDPKFDWLREYPAKRSITELEIQYGCLRSPSASEAFFFFRDSSFLKNVPDEYKKHFYPEDKDAHEKMENLKNTIKANNCNIRDYKCSWGGLKDGKPMVKGLEKFRRAVLEDLWNAICKTFPEPQTAEMDELSLERSYHISFIESRSRKFIGRSELLQQMTKLLNDDKHNTLVIVGKPGNSCSLCCNH